MDFEFEKDLPQERLATQGDGRTDKRVVCRYWIEGRCVCATWRRRWRAARRGCAAARTRPPRCS
jgi:hypothetical protein